MSALAGTVLLVVLCLALAALGAWDTTKTRHRHRGDRHARSPKDDA
jgi:hypothetical protein